MYQRDDKTTGLYKGGKGDRAHSELHVVCRIKKSEVAQWSISIHGAQDSMYFQVNLEDIWFRR